MPNPKVYSFKQALEISSSEAHRHLLLGNGFSISWKATIFSYDSLYKKLDKSKLHPKVLDIFSYFNTSDFEFVIKILTNSSETVKIFGDKKLSKTLLDESEKLKEALVKAITENHPDLPNQVTDNEYENCIKFLSNFKSFYTLNYDLLLYWVLMHFKDSDKKVIFNDGFKNPEEKSDYVVWEEDSVFSQNTYYLHGALHLFDGGFEFKKYTWINRVIPLIRQIKDSIDKDEYPMFVSEGLWKEKLEKIRHSGYLSRGLRSLISISGDLFIFGLSFSENDFHIIDKIKNNKKIKRIFVSIYGDINSETNKRIIQACKELSILKKEFKSNFEIYFFDSESAHVWR